ncbi:hypothetical protein AAHB34_16825 [Paenarthrobacter ureafaciens]
MADSSPLLTIVLEESGTLDRESVMYRRLVSARLRLESEFTILHIAEPLTTKSIARLCAEIDSKYVVFMRTSHQLSTNYVTTMLDYLRTRTVYLAEPVVYTGPIPNNVAATKIDQNYHYGRDTDVFGTAFNTRRLADALEAIGDIDRAGLYISYRLYWSLGVIKPLPTGFSVASETKAAIGLQLGDDVTRLVPLISSSSTEVRLHLVRFIAAFLRGLRAQKVSGVSLAHLRDVIHAFDLAEFANLLDPLQPFEGSWLRWLNEPEERYLYKQLSEGDSYLVFREGEAQESALQLYRLRLGG